MKKYTIAAVSFLMGVGGLATFMIIGTKIAPGETLIEPFWMVPVSYMFILIGIVLAIIIAIFKNREIRKKVTIAMISLVVLMFAGYAYFLIDLGQKIERHLDPASGSMERQLGVGVVVPIEWNKMFGIGGGMYLSPTDANNKVGIDIFKQTIKNHLENMPVPYSVNSAFAEYKKEDFDFVNEQNIGLNLERSIKPTQVAGLNGYQIDYSYTTKDGENHKARRIAVQSQDGESAYVFLLSGTSDSFDGGVSVLEDLLKTVVIKNN